MIPSWDGGNPIQGTPTPPTEPAGQPSSPPHYAGHTPAPGYGPNPTAQGVRGYRNLTATEVDTINQVKLMQEQVARVWASVVVGESVDPRKAASARTHFEEGFSALVGAVARPHDPYTAALQELHAAAQQSTPDPDLAQQSHDPRPDEGSRA